jgi:ACS family hexuronate transporter-like MFS transporter
MGSQCPDRRVVTHGWWSRCCSPTVINYVDRSVLGVVKPQLQKDLALNNTEYGLAVNAFLITYSALYILGGRLADRFGYRRMFPINVVFWSISCMLHSLARGLGSLCLFRSLLGVGEGGFYPSAIRATSELFGSEQRAKAVGIIMCGLSVGALVTRRSWRDHVSLRMAHGLFATGAVSLLVPRQLLHGIRFAPHEP